MNILDFRFNGDSAWWAFNFVANYININYSYMIKDVKHLQKKHEENALLQVSNAFKSGDFSSLPDYCRSNVEEILKDWWELATRLIVTYNDGGRTTGPNNVMEKIDYPKKWLQSTDFYNGPIDY